uniref:NADH-ubiquinone oxidoreductase chain 3 n=1 Tax=Altiverruca navicula TaxID=2099647 RepID=A0A343UTE9_9CRUS|nr:NADH dehydrogenase subunit 3 [Altiverruca navicula]AVI15457.1 NADH dehydrogenase subunit 3 [Altiverruca navicula]
MNMMIMSITLSMLISILLAVMATLFSKKPVLDREKASPFECGFDPKDTSRLPFSIRFFLIAIVFLIFDIEIAILLPISIISSSIPPLMWATTSFLFLILVTLGLFYEWIESTLDWIT